MTALRPCLIPARKADIKSETPQVNLPPGGDANTYDAIFASIKKHLMS